MAILDKSTDSPITQLFPDSVPKTRLSSHKFGGTLFPICLLALGFQAIIGAAQAVAQTCYTTGDPTYSTSTNEAVTICHNNSTDEGLYYNTPNPAPYSSYGQFIINVQPMRISPNTYRTLLHTNAEKNGNSPNCPLTATAGGTGEGYQGILSPATPPMWPTYTGLVYPLPYSTYAWCTIGDSLTEASYNATGPSDTTPYTLGATPVYVLWGSEINSNSASFYGNTTGTLTATLSSGLVSGTGYATLSVNPLPFPIGINGIITIGTGTTTQTVQLAPYSTTNLSSALVAGTVYSTLPTTGLSYVLTPGADLSVPITVNGVNTIQLVTTSGVATTLTSGLTSGANYSTLNVAMLPYGIAAGTVLTIGSYSAGGPVPQTVTVSTNASADSTSIAVTSFIANNSYPASTPVQAPAIPAGATTIPVNEFVPSSYVAVLANVYAMGLPQGATAIPIQAVTEPTTFPPVPGTGIVANASYPASTTITLQGDQGGLGGMGNQMTVAGRYYFPWNDHYYYSFFIGENRTDPSTTTCAWEPMSNGPCGWREILQEARTTDFVNWQVLSNKPVSEGGPWLNFSDISTTYYPVPVIDRNGNPIESNYPDTSGGITGLGGSVNQVYSPADGVHTFRYFYADHPAPTSGGSWQSDMQVYNLYERHASTDDSGAFDSTGNIIWSAPTLVGPAPDNGPLPRIARAHGSNRWALAFTASSHTSSTLSTDVRVDYTADMTTETHANWLKPLTHLLNNLPADSGHSLNVQVGRQFGTGYIATDSNGFQKAYYDGLVQIDFMTDREGNLAAPDVETPGWQRGGTLTWTEIPIADDATPGGAGLEYGGYGGNVYQAGFDVSDNVTGDLAVNGNFNTQVFTGNPVYDGWTMIDESATSNGGGANYPASILNSGSMFYNAVAALVGPSLTVTSESVGGSGIDQIVNIPAGSHDASVSFSYWNQCPAGAASGDFQAAYVYNVDTGAVTWVIPPMCDNSQTWKTGTADLSSFIGHPAQFIFQTRKVSTANTAPVFMLLGCSTSCFSVDVN